jgi:hypothetical protein
MNTHFGLTRPALASWGVSPANSASVNATQLAQVVARLAGQVVDMGGLTYRVPSIPAGCQWVNGYWLVADGTGALIRYPAEQTIPTRTVKITSNNEYSAWPQDKAHIFNDVLYVPYNEGTGHQTGLGVKIAYSDDGGYTWVTETPTIPAISGYDNEVCFAAGVVRGQQLLIVKYEEETIADPENPLPRRHKLLGRRLYDRVVGEIAITPETDEFIISNGTNFGLKPGDQFYIRGWTYGTVGGVAVLSGPYTVTNSTNTQVRVQRTGAAPGSAVEGDVVIETVQGAFAEITIGEGGIEFGRAVMLAAGLDPDEDAPPTLFHSFAPRDDIDRGGFYTGFHGTAFGGGTRLVRVDKLLATTAAQREIAWVRTINAAQGVEPSVVFHSGNLMGFIRRQAGSYPARFWLSSDELATEATLLDAPDPPFLHRQPIPCRIIGDQLFAFAAGERGSNDERVRGTIPLYLFHAPLSAVLTAEEWPFDAYHLGECYLSATNLNIGTNAVGLASLTPTGDGRLLVTWSDEHAPVLEDLDGQPDIWGAIIDVRRWTAAGGKVNLIGQRAT